MIITRTPFRISFAGGGTDLEAFYSREPGAVLSTAIDRYMYLTVKPYFGSGFRVSYSKTELVDRVDQIEHPIVRECLEELGVKGGLEIVSMADLPARSGMGSSSSFTVGLLHALHAMEGRVLGLNNWPRRRAASRSKNCTNPSESRINSSLLLGVCSSSSSTLMAPSWWIRWSTPQRQAGS